MIAPFPVGARGRIGLSDRRRQGCAPRTGSPQGFTEALRTPDSTLIFVTPEKAQRDPHRPDQLHGLPVSACQFSNWAQNEQRHDRARRPIRARYCIQKTLQAISHSDDVEDQLMFAGHNAFRFKDDPFYANGFIPTVQPAGRAAANRRLSASVQH